MHLVLYFLAGAIGVNGAPHFIKGITGEQHQTPFGNPSSAVANVLWGSLNLLVAYILWRYAGHNTGHAYRYIAAGAIGAFIMAVVLASAWSSRSKGAK